MAAFKESQRTLFLLGGGIAVGPIHRVGAATRAFDDEVKRRRRTVDATKARAQEREAQGDVPSTFARAMRCDAMRWRKVETMMS